MPKRLTKEQKTISNTLKEAKSDTRKLERLKKEAEIEKIPEKKLQLAEYVSSLEEKILMTLGAITEEKVQKANLPQLSKALRTFSERLDIAQGKASKTIETRNVNLNINVDGMTKEELLDILSKKTSPDLSQNISPLEEQIRHCSQMLEWKESCLSRDDHTCQKCGDKNKELHVDHLKPFTRIMKENAIKSLEDALQCNEFWDIDNGKTLCVDCHRGGGTYGAR